MNTQNIQNMSRLMGKPTICIGENKSVIAKLISAFVFATRIVQFLFYLNPKFQASSSFLCLYRSVCVGPVRKLHCWFSHEAAHILPSGITATLTISGIEVPEPINNEIKAFGSNLLIRVTISSNTGPESHA